MLQVFVYCDDADGQTKPRRGSPHRIDFNTEMLKTPLSDHFSTEALQFYVSTKYGARRKTDLKSINALKLH